MTPDGRQPLRILVIAYACNPGKGSEEGVGWSWVRAIARRHDVHVITAAFHRDAIEAELRERSEHGAPRFHHVAPRWWHYRPTPAWRRIEASPGKPLMNLAYAGWQRDALALARSLQAERPFDVVHLLTYVGFRFPGRFFELGVPFVWGPIGGLENTPWRLLPIMGGYGLVYFGLRNVVNSVQKAVLRRPRRALRRARGGILAATRGVQREIRRTYGRASVVLPEVGVEVETGTTPTLREAGEPLRVVWSGQHLPGKALNLLLDAVATLASEVDWSLDVLGDGPRSAAWRRRASRLGLDTRCRWHGAVERARALEVVGQAHVFAITSLKDLTSTVVLEALSLGVPVVCLDHCGFGEVVTPDCGIKVPVTRRREIVRGLARAVEALASDEARRRRLAAGALRRARDHAFDDKMDVLDRIYARKRSEAAASAPRVRNVASPARPAHVCLLGSRVDTLGLPEALARIASWIEAGPERCRHVVVTGFHGLWEAARTGDLRQVLQGADLWLPDGIAPVWAARLRGHRRAVRVPGADLMAAFFGRAARHGYRSYFYGDTSDTLAALEEEVRRRWPGHVVAGTLSPPFRPLTPEEDEEHVRRINEARPDVLWVGLGLPKQERWIAAHRDRLRVPVAVGVGAAFGFVSGRVRRAPAWMGSLGLEWAFRLAVEPRKVWRRALVDGPRFVLHVLLEALGITKYDYTPRDRLAAADEARSKA